MADGYGSSRRCFQPISGNPYPTHIRPISISKPYPASPGYRTNCDLVFPARASSQLLSRLLSCTTCEEVLNQNFWYKTYQKCLFWVWILCILEMTLRPQPDKCKKTRLPDPRRNRGMPVACGHAALCVYLYIGVFVYFLCICSFVYFCIYAIAIKTHLPNPKGKRGMSTACVVHNVCAQHFAKNAKSCDRRFSFLPLPDYSSQRCKRFNKSKQSTKSEHSRH